LNSLADQTYVVLAMRCWLYFNGTNRRANYLRITSQLYFTLTMGDKPAFQAPCWYYPSGGGVWGFDAVTSIFNLGDPTHESILKLARPIMVPVRQNFAVEAQFFTVGATNALTLLNTGATDDEKVIMFDRKVRDRLAA
jgi:hypothetical protein